MSDLSTEGLAALEEQCTDRLTALAKRGVQFGGLDVHYVQALLEALLTPQQIATAKAEHFMWLAGNLDNAEAQIRQAFLTQGVAGLNGGKAKR